ncbi:MAG: AMP-binding protein [Pseudomonadota bacterium]|nr:AMP-binding protein [Pseudomonadota bacterium]
MTTGTHAAARDAQRAIVNPFAGRDVNWLLDHRAEKSPDRPFLIWEPFEGPSRTWTYAAFRDRVARLAAGLAARGIGEGDRVLVHLDNCPEMEFLWFAIQRIGAIVVTTNTRSSADELEYFADNCGAVAAITQPELAELVARACRHVKWVAVTEAVVGGGAPPANLMPDAGSAFSAIDADPAGMARPKADPWRHGSVQYTSGTTSRPKGVLWTQGNALWGARTSALNEGLTAADVHLVQMPTFHTNARTYSILPTMWTGGAVVMQPRFSASRFWDVATRNGCTWASMLPFFCKAVQQQERPEAHSFRMFGMSGNELPWDGFFGIRSIGWWGMTETITHGLIGEASSMGARPGSTGRPGPGYDIRVLREDGTMVEPGEVGRLQCRGWRGIQLFLEYLGNEKATNDSFDADGWFDTGDRVRLDEDGWITFADRDKDMLKVGGENVAASEIERVVATVGGVYENAVVARKDRMLDEVPVVFVIPAPGVGPEAHEGLKARILAECRDKLADFKRPREVFVVSEMPRSTLEKVHKAELRKRLAEMESA